MALDPRRTNYNVACKTYYLKGHSYITYSMVTQVAGHEFETLRNRLLYYCFAGLSWSSGLLKV